MIEQVLDYPSSLVGEYERDTFNLADVYCHFAKLQTHWDSIIIGNGDVLKSLHDIVLTR